MACWLARCARHTPLGPVKRHHRRRCNGPFPKRVHAADGINCRRGLAHTARSPRRSLPQARRLIRLHAWSSDTLDEQARGEQRLIANHFGESRKQHRVREQAIVGVGRLRIDDCRLTIVHSQAATSSRDSFRALQVRRTRNDRLHQPLHIPAMFDKVNRQPVENFRMNRWLALSAKVLGRFDQAFTKSCCQMRLTVTRAVSGCSRLVNQRASAERSGRVFRQRWKARGHAGLDLFAGSIVLAARQQIRLPQAGLIEHHHHRRQLLFEHASFFPQLFVLGDLLAIGLRSMISNWIRAWLVGPVSVSRQI